MYAEFAQRKSGGDRGRRAIYARGERCRQRMGQLWSVPAERIAFTPSAAEGMAWLARGLDWRPGDNVVTTNLEFPSVAYNWRNVREQGVELRLVPHCDWLVREEDLLAAVDERTRVLAVSQVSFYTGQNLDIEQLAAEACRARRALGGSMRRTPRVRSPYRPRVPTCALVRATSGCWRRTGLRRVI